MSINTNRARVLQKSVRYPAYQLSACSVGSEETVEKRIVLGALHVLEWVRAKFQEFEIPRAFMAPDPADYLQVKLSDLESAYINEGYTVETICLPDHNLWAFRLIEPDLSVSWKNGNPVSTSVPGRIFETNIAFSAVGSQVRCGVKIMMSEPEGVEIPSRVFRPAFVRHLAEDPKFGLICGYPIQNSLFELRTRDRIKRLRDYLESGSLPVTVFCEVPPKASGAPMNVSKQKPPVIPSQLNVTTQRMPAIPQNLMLPPGVNSNFDTFLQIQPPKPSEEPLLPPYTEKYVRSRMGYVHSFRLPGLQREYFRQIFHISSESSGILFMEPKRFGGSISVFPSDKSHGEETFGKLMEMSRDYLRGKPVPFDQVLFLNDVKLLQTAERRAAAHSSEEMASAYEEKIALLENSHAGDLMLKNETIAQQARTITSLKDALDSANERIGIIKEEFQEKLDFAIEREKMLADHIQFLESLRSRPNSPKEIPKWASERFAGRLQIHSRAEKILQSISSKAVDVQLLCDSLEYLASEYRDQKIGTITREKADMTCSRKYHRPFVITPCGSTAIEKFPEDYKIPYASEKKGQPQEVALNWHLKIGKTSENMIRIYFFYDDKKKIVVVGSLPYHLRAAQIQA